MSTTTTTFRDATDPSPLILNFGGGVDSTAILVGLASLYRLGDLTARPDLILFADVGDEVAETYANVSRVSDWCVAQGFPAVTTVSRPLNIRGRVGYRSLSENCIINETLPSEAFGRGACSIKWKHEPMDAFLFGRKRPYREGWIEAQGYAGHKPTKLIGYDATETQKGKRSKWAKVAEDAVACYRFPLVEWNWTRRDCIQASEGAGLPAVVKSACFMCPNQTEPELRTMAAQEPALILRAFAIEEIARRGKNGLRKIEGLWRRTRKGDGRPGAWLAWARKHDLLESIETRAGIRLEALLSQLKPSWVAGFPQVALGAAA